MTFLRNLRAFFTDTQAWIEFRSNGDGTQRDVMVARDEFGQWREIERRYERDQERGGGKRG